ncbi:MAG: glucose-6-phosphate isomerase, partial [Candidatus Omnitrophica bacterium]|nr:glucose-6-phosphate isomerase [Candidatus Omnitrophota bacterium]
MESIRLATENVSEWVSAAEMKALGSPLQLIHTALAHRDCPGNDFLGWLHLPASVSPQLLADIQETAEDIRRRCEVFLVLGIGGSYLGARAALEFLQPNFMNEQPGQKTKVYFAGQNLSADYLQDLLRLVGKKRLMVNVISKSGTTTETAVVFRIIRQFMEKKYGKKKAAQRIIATTDQARGALRQLATAEGYKTFVIPDDIGGRFSVLTPVGLLPIAAAGIDIRQLIRGAAAGQRLYAQPDMETNPVDRYVAIRHILYRKGKIIELLSGFHPGLHFV